MILNIDLSGINIPDRLTVVGDIDEDVLDGVAVLFENIVKSVENDLAKALEETRKRCVNGYSSTSTE